MVRHIHAYAYLQRPYDAVRLAFSNELIEVLEHAEGEANARALTVSRRLAVPLGPMEVGREVSIDPTGFEQTPPRAGHPSCRLRLTWKATHSSALFPVMQAELVAHPIGDDETQLALFGTYSPPLGALGNVGDAVIGHRVAEAAAHRFVQSVVTQLEEMIPPT